MKPAHLFRRVWNSMGLGTVSQVDDAGPVLKVQLQVGSMEIMDGKPLLQQYGLSSVPPIGTDVHIVFIGGDRSNGVGIASNHQATRPKGRQPGETTVFNSSGMSVYLSANGIVINGGGKPVHIINGDLHVDGAVIGGFGGADQVGLQTHRGHSTTGGPPVAGS